MLDGIYVRDRSMGVETMRHWECLTPLDAILVFFPTLKSLPDEGRLGNDRCNLCGYRVNDLIPKYRGLTM